MSKFGLSQEAAASVSNGLVPNVMSQLVNKTNDPSDSSFDLGGIFNTLSGGKTQGMDFSNLLSGDSNLKDIASKFTGTDASSGIGGMLGNLFGK